ncbi:MAG: hypothetical protein QXQ79_02435, partial [Candidatus Nanoarchaeia archaeon]
MIGEEDIALAEYVEKKISETANDVLISLESSQIHELKFVNNAIIKADHSNEKNMAICAIFGKKIVFANLKDFTKKSADKCIEDI